MEKEYLSIFGKFSIRWTGSKAPSMELEIRIVELVGSMLPNIDRYRNFMTQEYENGTWVSSLVVSYPTAAKSELDLDLRYGPDESGFSLQIKEGGTENVIGSLFVPEKVDL